MPHNLSSLFGNDVADFITTQNYTPQKPLDGVKLIEVKRFTGEDGSFNETVRLGDDGKVAAPEALVGFEIKQINYSRVVANTVKAWHVHTSQDEIWFVHPESKLIVGLLDIRKDSPTYKKTMRFSFGDGKANLLYIPRGVAHGLSNPYFQDSTMEYLVSNNFTGEDELRLPFNYLVGRDFWDLTKG